MMKKLLQLLFITSAMAFGQTTYTWNVASGAWTTAASWTPNRTTPAIDDILVFDGSTQATPSVTGIPKETIGQLFFINIVNVTFSSLTATAGTGTVSKATTAVTGVGTSFTTEVIVGDLIYGNTTGATYDVTAIGSNTSITVNQSGTVSSQSFSICPRLSIGGGTGTDFFIESGCTVSFAVTAAPGIVINLKTGATGEIGGTIKFHNSGTAAVGHRILVADASGLIVSGTVEQATATGTNTFNGSMFGVTGTGTANSVTFQNGSTFIQRSGSNPFALAQPSSVVVFSSQNNYKFYLSGSPSLGGRTYGNFIVGEGANCNPPTGLAADCIMYDVIQESGAAIALSSTTTGNGGILHIKGNVTQSGTFACTLANNTKATSAILFDGGGTQTISGAGSSTTTFKNRVKVASGTTVVLSRNVVTDSLFQVDGTLYTETSTVSSGTGAPVFTLSSGGTLGIGSTDGILPGGVPIGNIRTTTSNFNTGADYIYNGSSAQQTGAGFPATVNNLTINNSAGVTLNQPVTVSGVLTLTSGNLQLGNNDITLFAAVAGSPSASNHIFTNGPGKVVKNIAPSGSFFFPVGYNATTYNLVTVALDGASTADDFFVNVASGVNPTANDNTTAVQATWGIFETTHFGSNATLTFQWTAAQEGGSFTRGSSAVWYHDGLNWVNVSGGTLVGSDPYTLTTTTVVSSFELPGGGSSPFIVGKTSGLPVEITSFTAVAKGKNIELQWKTATEVNNHGFDIEKSVNGVWSKIGFVSGAGTSNAPKEYGYVDAVSENGTYSYRLKQIDRDGKFKYSSIVDANVVIVNEYAVSQNYPNPFNPSTKINFTVKLNEHATVKIFDVTGREVATLFNAVAQTGQIYTVQFNASQFASGVYFYELSTKNFRDVKKMQLLK